MRLLPHPHLPQLATSVLALVCSASPAAPLQLRPAQDASLYAGTPDAQTLADGSGPHLWLATTAEGLTRRALLRFDLAGVPAGSVLRSARLVLYQSRSRSDHVVRVHRVLQAWGEGPANSGAAGGGAPAAAGDVTWLNRLHPSQAWQQPGATHQAAASAQALVGPPNQAYVFESAQLTADVQAWLQQPASNHGWLLVGDEAQLQSAKRFESRENTSAANQPRLELDFEDGAQTAQGDVPVPGWAVAALALMVSATLGRRVT